MSNGQEEGVLNISKVKDINLLGIKPTYVLLEIIGEKETRIKVDPSIRTNNIRWRVFRVGEAVKNREIGDIVIDINLNGVTYLQKDKDKYVYCDDYNIKLSTPETNYKVDGEKNLKLN